MPPGGGEGGVENRRRYRGGRRICRLSRYGGDSVSCLACHAGGGRRSLHSTKRGMSGTSQTFGSTQLCNNLNVSRRKRGKGGDGRGLMEDGAVREETSGVLTFYLSRWPNSLWRLCVRRRYFSKYPPLSGFEEKTASEEASAAPISGRRRLVP